MDGQTAEEAWLVSLPVNPPTPGGYEPRLPPDPHPPIGPNPPTPTGYSWNRADWDEI